MSSETQIQQEAFSVTYTDFTFILLVFFVFLDSVTTPDALRQSAILDTLAKEFTADGYSQEKDSPLTIGELADGAKFEVIRTKGAFVITAPGAELFESGDDKLKPEMLPDLISMAKMVAKHDLVVRIEGHTDNQPIQTTRFPSNWALSVARATSVLRLFAKHGVSPKNLSAAGRGEFKPVAANDTEEGRAQNRRVVIRISGKQLRGI